MKKALGHYLENTGNTDLVYMEVFRADRFEEVSLSDSWRTAQSTWSPIFEISIRPSSNNFPETDLKSSGPRIRQRKSRSHSGKGDRTRCPAGSDARAMAIAISVCYDEPNDQCIAPQQRSHRIPGSWNPNNRRCTPRAKQRVCVFNCEFNFDAPLRVSKWPLAPLLAAGLSFLYPAIALSAGRDKSESVAKNTDSWRDGSVSP